MIRNAVAGTIWSSHRAAAATKSLFAWGYNNYGQLGDGTTTARSSPVPIGAATDWTAVAAGGCRAVNYSSFSFGIRGGKLFAWGYGSYGQLGTGGIGPYSSPVQIGAATDWSLASTSGYARYGLTLGLRSGALFAWGYNASGQLGNGASGVNQSSPVPIGAATDWTAVAAGGPFALGVRGGKLFSWGNGAYGVLGDGTTSRSSPVSIGAATDWTAVAASANNSNKGSSFGIRSGTLFSWGYGGVGELGHGNTTSYSSPVQVGSDANWAVISSGGANTTEIHTLGVRGGALFSWGSNIFGQLGNGASGVNQSSPVPIGAATDWTAVAAGGASSLGIRSGLLFAWGLNNHGQIGDGSTTNRSSPVPVGAVTSWSVIAAGSYQSLGLR